MVLWLALQAAAGAYDPQGVHVDPQGVLRSRSVSAELQKPDRKAPKPKLLYLSLPRLLAEARKGQPPPDVQFLGGLTRLQYVFVYPDDLVIAGPAEAF